MNIITQEDSNDVEDILKDVENKLKFESLIEKNLFKAENYLKKDDWKIVLNISDHCHQNIERVWPYFNDFTNFKANFKLEALNIKEEPKENKVGNLFEGNYYDYSFHGKMLKIKNTYELKKVEWIFYFENDEIFKIKITIYRITYDNSCVIDFKIKYVPKLGQNIIDIFIPEIDNKQIFQQIEKKIQNQFKAIYQYESCIIQGSPEDIWDILSDNSKLVLIAPNNECFLPLNINKIKLGQTVEIKMNINDKECTIEVKMDLLRKKIGNKWIFCYTILGGKPFEILKQSLFAQLTKINSKETQLSIFTNIYENISSENVAFLSKQKRYVLSSLKDYFMNFYTPNDVNNGT